MSQTQSDSTQTPSRPPAQPAAAGNDDPLSHLHKMSTTAGLGSGEYVAVNGAAVFALLLGLASGLALLEEVLLVIPITCVIVSIVAWRQINHSNGTQTGKGLVAVALLCALGFGGFVVARETTRGLRTRDDRAAIRQLVQEFGDKVKAGDVAGAYAMFSDRFRESVDTERFNRTMGQVRENEIYGKLLDTQWNGLAEFQTDDTTGQRFAITKMKMTFEKTQVDVDTMLRKDGARWVFHSMTTFFPPQQQPGRQ